MQTGTLQRQLVTHHSCWQEQEYEAHTVYAADSKQEALGQHNPSQVQRHLYLLPVAGGAFNVNVVPGEAG